MASGSNGSTLTVGSNGVTLPPSTYGAAPITVRAVYSITVWAVYSITVGALRL